MTYKNKHGQRYHFNRWGPANGEHDGQTYVNHTENYINYMSNRIGLNCYDEVPAYLYSALMLAMSDFKGAKGAFTIAQAREGVALAAWGVWVIARKHRAAVYRRI